MSTSLPIELVLHRIYLMKAGAFRLELQFDDHSYLHVDFEPESDGHRQLMDVLTRVLPRTLTRLGERGVAITGMTTVAPEESEEQ
jgi:hypothetical protein